MKSILARCSWPRLLRATGASCVASIEAAHPTLPSTIGQSAAGGLPWTSPPDVASEHPVIRVVGIYGGDFRRDSGATQRRGTGIVLRRVKPVGRYLPVGGPAAPSRS